VSVVATTFSFADAQQRWDVSPCLADRILVWLVAQQFIVEVGDEYAVTDLGREISELWIDAAREWVVISA
jgi:hypothetical protein